MSLRAYTHEEPGLLAVMILRWSAWPHECREAGRGGLTASFWHNEINLIDGVGFILYRDFRR